METIEINKLKPHLRNNEFFDDIQGDNWLEFKKSVESSGVIEPIVISQDCLIVSGHQRVRACEELGIKEIPCRIKIYEATDKWSKEDVILKELLETNLRQRGIGNLNGVKFARCIVELERIYGIENGNNQHRAEDNLQAKKKSELASDLGATQQHINAYKKLLTLIPELQDLIETGQMTPTVGYKVWAKLPQEEQARLVEELGKDKISEMTQKQTEQYLKEIENIKAGYELRLARAKEQNKENSDDQIEELIQERDELKQKYRNQFDAAQQLKDKLEEAKKDVKKSKEYKDLLSKVNDHQTHLDNLNNIIREQEEQLVILKKSKDNEDYYNANVDDVAKPVVEEVTFNNLFSMLNEYARFTNIYTFEGGIYEQIDKKEKGKLLLAANEVLENTNKIITILKGSK